MNLPRRLDTIDFLRGIAVFIMIIANSTPYIFNLSSYNTLRIIFSLAAPIFIFLAGYTTQMNFENNKSEKLIRIFQVILIAVIIDIFVWRSIPFYTFDVLYLIGASKLLLFILNKYANRSIKIFILFLFIGVLIFLSKYFFYRFPLSDLNINILYNDPYYYFKAGAIKRFLYDGWFPIFPWFIIVLMGSLSYKYNNIKNRFFLFLLILTGLSALIFLVFYFNMTTFIIREKYFEIWYPLYGIKLLLPIAVIFIIIGTINLYSNINFSFFNILGQNSLFAYLLNAIFDSILDSYNLNNYSMVNKVSIFLLSLFIIVIATFLLYYFKSKSYWKRIPFLFKFLMGA
jgi:uncharacterized membrane protein